MSDSTFPQNNSRESSSDGEMLPGEEVPQFGAVDIVEAFTAMRHEWRGQTRESRALAERIQAAVTHLQSLEAKLAAMASGPRPAASADAGTADAGTADARPLALLVVETDHQLSRAVEAIAGWEASQRRREAANAEAVDCRIAAMNPLVRRLARPLLTLLAEQRAAQESAAEQSGAEHPAVEGLNMVLARLRRMMHEQGIERIDALGQPFDANLMRAVGTVASAEVRAGHVAEQFSPAYRWQGRLLRFADVRVAGE